MASLQPPPGRSPAVYRSHDPIENFRLRVQLQRVTSSSLFLEMARQEGDEMELKQMRHLESHSAPDVHTFCWQEKIFSKAELEKYSQPQISQTPLEQKYHKEVAKMIEMGKTSPTLRLFSYVDNDDPSRNYFENSMTTSPSEEQVVRSRNVSAKSKICSVWHKMIIMADLSPEAADLNQDSNKVTLCTILYNSGGTLIMNPDFNPQKVFGPYNVESGGLDAWEFYIENESENMTRLEISHEMKLMKQLYERHSKVLESIVGTEFDMPPAESLRIMCHGEIVSAKGFEYDSLYIVWCVIPGKWWWGSLSSANGTENSSSSVLTGITHCCNTGDSGKAMFCECFQLQLLYRNLSGQKPDENEDLRPNLLRASELPFQIEEWPQLLIQVMSRDSWHRTRTEGYGAITLPHQPGCHSIDISCWRPMGGPLDEMRRYFIGGSPELNDPFYAVKPHLEVTKSGSKITHLNRFGFRTLSTGTVRLRLNLLFQSQALVDGSKNVRSKSGTPYSRFVPQGLKDKHGGMFHLVSIVQSFQQARARMVQAKEQVLKDLKTE